MQDVAPLLAYLRCPVARTPLALDGAALVADPGGPRYRLSASGIPLLGERERSPEAARQQEHYDRVAAEYLENLEAFHTAAYSALADRAVLGQMVGRVDVLVEVCCGRGEALRLPGLDYRLGIGVDISTAMLEAGLASRPRPGAYFVHGDAAALPLRDGCCDAVAMLGGIHHVNDRAGLFREVARILTPGGQFVWREPVDDFLPWRLARAAVYRLSPALDAETERPLRLRETEPVLREAGLRLERWETLGFLAWCLLMNGDVLVVNRLLQYLPGIRRLVRAGARLDQAALRLPGMAGRGVQVVGRAVKPLAPPSP